MKQIVLKTKFNKEKIAAEPLEISRELIKSVFDDFNWKDYAEHMIKTHQENLLNRRI